MANFSKVCLKTPKK